MLRTAFAFRMTWVFATSCALSALAFGTAAAGKPAPRIRPSPGPVPVVGARLAPRGATCTAGAAGPVTFAVDYLLPDGDAYYTAITCTTCPAPDSASVQEVRIALAFPVSCAVPVAISIVAAKGDPSCREPDTLVVISEPEPAVLDPAGTGNREFVVVLSRPMRFSGDAFLCVNVLSLPAECAASGSRPELLTNASCGACRTWNISSAGGQDLCAVQFPGQPVMYALAASCVVPVRTRSWGALRTLYR